MPTPVAELERRIAALEQQVRQLVDADRIAEAVAESLRARRAQMFSVPVKLAAVAAAVAAVFDAGWRVYMIVRR
jgi:type VI protein secretion system component VasF